MLEQNLNSLFQNRIVFSESPNLHATLFIITDMFQFYSWIQSFNAINFGNK